MNPENPEDGPEAMEAEHEEIEEQDDAVQVMPAENESVEPEINPDLEVNVNRVGDDIPVDREVVIEANEEPIIEQCNYL